MPKSWELSLDRYDITKERYRELLHWCRQYKEWQARSDYGLKAINNDGMPHGTGISNPTEQQALKNERYLANIVLLETTAQESDREIWRNIILNVTEGITYEDMHDADTRTERGRRIKIYKGRRQFYNSRRRFFYMLDIKRP